MCRDISVEPRPISRRRRSLKSWTKTWMYRFRKDVQFPRNRKGNWRRFEERHKDAFHQAISNTAFNICKTDSKMQDAIPFRGAVDSEDQQSKEWDYWFYLQNNKTSTNLQELWKNMHTIIPCRELDFLTSDFGTVIYLRGCLWLKKNEYNNRQLGTMDNCLMVNKQFRFYPTLLFKKANSTIPFLREKSNPVRQEIPCRSNKHSQFHYDKHFPFRSAIRR